MPAGGAGDVGKKSAADILAAFRSRIDRRMAGEPDPAIKEDTGDGQTFFLTTSAAVRRRRHVKKQTKRKAKVRNVPASLEYKHLKELLEKATGPVIDGHIDEERTAWLAFEKAEDAQALLNDFDGGKISGESIEVELLSDSEPLGKR
ncbi:unnamed protein product [Effrenium voratum]|uniref:RRM domain-containing protein n=2 Tax=Effrenium voratum TaxID=2562239 RepID=A0AA36I0I3_9DINO|nr:unnamed protein product [Effrenium voratum]CAJ1442180.1 unnamed protein product [Effrenium voratum]